MNKVKTVSLAIIQNKWFCLAWLIFGCAYMTWFGFLENPMQYTASMIGLDYPVGFIFWGVFQSISLVLNVLYLYRRYGYSSRFGYVCLIIAAICIGITVNVPSTEIFGLQLVMHWSTALLFAIFNAIAMGLCLVNKAKHSKKFMATFVLFIAMLLSMIVLLIIFGKSGIIEKIPMWGAYLILLLTNFTGLYKESLPKQ